MLSLLFLLLLVYISEYILSGFSFYPYRRFFSRRRLMHLKTYKNHLYTPTLSTPVFNPQEQFNNNLVFKAFWNTNRKLYNVFMFKLKNYFLSFVKLPKLTLTQDDQKLYKLFLAHFFIHSNARRIEVQSSFRPGTLTQAFYFVDNLPFGDLLYLRFLLEQYLILKKVLYLEIIPVITKILMDLRLKIHVHLFRNRGYNDIVPFLKNFEKLDLNPLLGRIDRRINDFQSPIDVVENILSKLNLSTVSEEQKRFLIFLVAKYMYIFNPNNHNYNTFISSFSGLNFNYIHHININNLSKFMNDTNGPKAEDVRLYSFPLRPDDKKFGDHSSLNNSEVVDFKDHPNPDESMAKDFRFHFIPFIPNDTYDVSKVYLMVSKDLFYKDDDFI